MTYFCGKNYENGEIDLPLFEELGQTSRDPSDTWSETLRSRDVCLNSLKNSCFDVFLCHMTYFSGKNYENGEIALPLFEELGQTSRDIFDTWPETRKSRDVRLNSSKNCFFIFWGVSHDTFFRRVTPKMAKSTCHFLKS